MSIDEETRTGDARGAGGTAGGVGEILFGGALALAGAYLLTNQVTVSTGYWQLWGHSAFGLSLLPLLIGIGILFYDGRSAPGWILTAAAAVIIVVGIITNLQVYFRPTSLFNTLLMLGLLAAGLGLVVRALRAH